MQRITVTLDDGLVEELDRLIGERGYASRSEAIRDLARAGLRQGLLDSDAAPDCVATLTYVYDHGARDLAFRLTALLHDHHDLCVAATHTHLNHESGLEVVLLRGATESVRRLADRVLTERGVRHGQLVLVPVTEEAGMHDHGGAAHVHVRTR